MKSYREKGRKEGKEQRGRGEVFEKGSPEMQIRDTRRAERGREEMFRGKRKKKREKESTGQTQICSGVIKRCD